MRRPATRRPSDSRSVAARRNPAVGRRVAHARVERAGEPLDLLLRLVLGDPVDFLDAARELLAAAADLLEVVVRELAPLLANLPRNLLPIPLDAIPVHWLTP